MKKMSVEILLLLSSFRDRKQVADFCKDLKALDAAQIDTLLSRFDEYRLKTFSAASAALEEQLEIQKAKAEEDRRAREEDRQKKAQISDAAQQVLRLLLTRYKLKVPEAAHQLSSELEKKGYRAEFKGEPTKPNFTKWVKELCEEMPPDAVINSALNLRVKN